MLQEPVAQLLGIDDVGADGARAQVKLKVVDLGDAGVWWQAREVFGELCRHRDRLEVNEVINKHIARFHVWYAFFGWAFEDIISRSRKSADKLGVDAADALRKSWYLSSIGSLSLLWWWSSERKRVDERSAGRRLLHGFVCRAIPANRVSDMDWKAKLIGRRGRCKAEPLRNACCVHLAALLDTLQTERDLAPQRV